MGSDTTRAGTTGPETARPQTAGPQTARPQTAGPETTGELPAISKLLAEARAGLERVGPQQAFAMAGRGGLLVDTRPSEQRSRYGTIPGALVVDRNVLAWRLDPTSPHKLPEVLVSDQEIVVICQEGYSSSLAAATLRLLGLRRATDLDGGFLAWAAAGLPVQAPPAGVAGDVSAMHGPPAEGRPIDARRGGDDAG